MKEVNGSSRNTTAPDEDTIESLQTDDIGPADVNATESTNITGEAASQGNGSVGKHVLGSKVTLGSERHILPDKQGKEITNSNDASLEVHMHRVKSCSRF